MRTIVVIILIPLWILSPLVANDDVSEGEKLFALHVKPLIAEKCLACHGAEPDDIQGGLDLRTRETLIAGGDSFEAEVLIPGKGNESYLYRTASRSEEGYEMPPKEADQLTEAQAWWIRDWIDAGAPWPDEQRTAMIQQRYAEGEQVATSKALSEDWQNRRYQPQKLWAYRPLQPVSVPAGKHPVDWFIDEKLTAAGLAPAPPAPAGELVRRMSFGLTGLPPSPEDVKHFTREYAKDRENAVRTLAQQLMASPHYGEQFGLRWLDVVRYADTAGFANDYSRPNAWRYRDYVVRAFNDDQPYDVFIRQQIAGDEIDPDDPENLIATGFLRMGPWEQTGMSVFKETRQQWLDDITDSVGQTFLAHALQCAKCHDHKFDPVPTRDYYSMMAVFSTTQFAERDAPFLDVENKAGFEASDDWVQAKVDAYQQQKKELNQKVAQARKQETGDAKVGDNGLDPGDEASLARMSKNIARHSWELDRTRPIAFAVYTGKTIQRNNVGNRIELPENPWGKGQLETDAILAGGNVYSPTDPVQPGPLSAAVALGQMQPPSFPAGKGKRRLALAQWIAAEDNPLTARVIVNRVWSWHFGKGLAGNPNNFGGTGALPTHPQLLDHLARRFMDQGWSIKKLNELIVTSQAYRRSSRHPQPQRQAALDPKGNLYASFLPRRLTAEEIRDAMLVASGELNRSVGGVPARPDVNLEVAFQPRQIMGGAASVYEPDPTPRQRNRRSLYAEKIRGLRDPFLESFNQPGPDKSCELRETSTVAPQALTLLNSEEVFDRSIAFAKRLVDQQLDDETTIDRAFQWALGRSPTAEERALCLVQWNDAIAEESSRSYQARTWPDRIERTVMAEKTGQPYDFIETMPAYTHYQPDLQPADVDAKTRGLAHVCLVIFNLNEFAYLD
ncbi:PSD1 and planctomycete cytochrome C domain-containing protein [Stieleria sp. ICT_E10.1]|uniref:PSD1 and planctomycete cytochrome C domain-containing protein n=1 Tax=Stieleria sedimenti TaxID=2976331 RepID=UPI00217F6CB7|nr:PSD1 and planctomycete cytochrome C domain-containing protein [Stieleria sedimenti]MCS7465707.1 PSD1 and planctomycete cytochrome C domain-containing protein [Stieleria sedimenti]